VNGKLFLKRNSGSLATASTWHVAPGIITIGSETGPCLGFDQNNSKLARSSLLVWLASVHNDVVSLELILMSCVRDTLGLLASGSRQRIRSGMGCVAVPDIVADRVQLSNDCNKLSYFTLVSGSGYPIYDFS
jgi:hypothetical protein